MLEMVKEAEKQLLEYPKRGAGYRIKRMIKLPIFLFAAIGARIRGKKV